MIEADKKTAFESLFYQYNKWLLKRSFHSIMLSRQSAALPQEGSIVLLNHSSWWDPLVLFYCNQAIWKKDAVAMMGIEGLQRFPFFRRLGAFSVDPRSSKSVMESLNYSAAQLENNKHVFLFPQGEESPLEKRPLQFFSGAGYLKQKVPTAPVVNVSYYHGLFHHQLPEWFVHVSSPLQGETDWNRKIWTGAMENYATKELDTLRDWVLHGGEFQTILQGRAGIGQNWEKLKRKAGLSK